MKKETLLKVMATQLDNTDELIFSASDDGYWYSDIDGKPLGKDKYPITTRSEINIIMHICKYLDSLSVESSEHSLTWLSKNYVFEEFTHLFRNAKERIKFEATLSNFKFINSVLKDYVKCEETYVLTADGVLDKKLEYSDKVELLLPQSMSPNEQSVYGELYKLAKVTSMLGGVESQDLLDLAEREIKKVRINIDYMYRQKVKDVAESSCRFSKIRHGDKPSRSTVTEEINKIAGARETENNGDILDDMLVLVEKDKPDLFKKITVDTKDCFLDTYLTDEECIDLIIKEYQI